VPVLYAEKDIQTVCYSIGMRCFEGGWPKISCRRGHSLPTIVLVGKLGWYKNVGRHFFSFVTIHAFDRWMDTHIDRWTDRRI